ncbi:hypothetical protein BD779DRAFT_1545473 [Infundibulicybe gibba]|nr:hypothetical protein BD779DRAFT_1545473 [Infundibulicybe gibba]
MNPPESSQKSVKTSNISRSETESPWSLRQLVCEFARQADMRSLCANIVAAAHLRMMAPSVVTIACQQICVPLTRSGKALGAARIIAVDIVPARLEFAKQYAATDTFLPPKPNDGESRPDYSRRNAATMKEQLGITDRGKGSIDLALDASGAEVSVQTALFVTKAGGTYVQVRAQI